MSFKKFSPLTLLLLALLAGLTYGDINDRQVSLPNRGGKAMERFFGLGVALPYPYFQKPSYRYPVYDRNGRGSLLYGYGGPETFQYRDFTPIEGHH